MQNPNAPRIRFSRYETGPNPEYTIIWMHGLGDEGASFHTLVSTQFDLTGLPPIRFIFPDAPERPVTAHSWLPCRAWFDIMVDFDETDQEDEEGIMDSEGIIHVLMNQEKIKGIKPENIFLAGFSQGAAMALHTGLSYFEKLGGIIALSGYIPMRKTFGERVSPQNRDTPVFMAHGDDDPVVPYKRGVLSKGTLESLGFNVDWHTYQMDHTLAWDEVQDMVAWLKPLMNK